MAFVYVLESVKSEKRYVGSTLKTPSVRVKEHNGGNTTWTRKHKPFKLLYYEEFDNISEAQRREKYFKSGSGREWLLRRFPKA